ncbi:MAG: 50S ribosomal protein L10 [Chlorobi bacterium]|nr:50S ribosomal protein L10 [Chlorobiota bacterium]
MTREEKNAIIDALTEQINATDHLYLTDISTLNALDTSALRRKCFENGIELIVVKNTLLKRALDKADKDFNDLFDVLKDSTSLMLTETANLPAKLIKEFRKNHDRPVLKAAFVEESIYMGDDQLETLASLKSKEELIGDIILLLQSPMKNVISSLQSGGNILTGVLKTLSEKEN